MLNGVFNVACPLTNLAIPIFGILGLLWTPTWPTKVSIDWPLAICQHCALPV